MMRYATLSALTVFSLIVPLEHAAAHPGHPGHEFSTGWWHPVTLLDHALVLGVAGAVCLAAIVLAVHVGRFAHRAAARSAERRFR